MIRTIAWLGQVLLWVRLGWPFAVSVWNILRDGQLTHEEALAAVDLAWPRDENYEPVIIAIPFMKKLRTERNAPSATVHADVADHELHDATMPANSGSDTHRGDTTAADHGRDPWSVG